MKKHWIYMAAALLLLGGCAARPSADGKLEKGARVIEISSGFSDVHAYRGETVTLSYSGSGNLTLGLPDFKVQESGNGAVSVTFKAVETGSYIINVTVDDKKQSGQLVIEELAETNVYKSVNAKEFEAAMTGEYLLLDVRTQTEYDAGYIEGAVLIPHTELESRLDEIKGYNKVLVYCASGNRSVTASQILVDAGYKEVYNLSSGYSGWHDYKEGIN